MLKLLGGECCAFRYTYYAHSKFRRCPRSRSSFTLLFLYFMYFHCLFYHCTLFIIRKWRKCDLKRCSSFFNQSFHVSSAFNVVLHKFIVTFNKNRLSICLLTYERKTLLHFNIFVFSFVSKTNRSNLLFLL